MNKKKNNNPFITLALVFLVFTFLVGATSWDLVLYSFSEPTDIYAEDFDIVEHGTGGRIETELYASLGNCASETRTTKKYGVTTSSSTDHYYAIPVYSPNGEEYYICVKVDESDQSAYERMVDNTYLFFETFDYSYLEKSNIPVEGSIKKLDDDIFEYMIECFEEIDYYETSAELNKYVLPYYIEPMDFDTAPVMLIIFIVLLALTILFFVLFFKKQAKLKAQAATYQTQTVPYDQAAPYNQAVPYDQAVPYNQGYPANNYDSVTINGTVYPKHIFANVNQFVYTGETIKAIKELRDVTGLDLSTAKNVVDNWNQYYV